MRTAVQTLSAVGDKDWLTSRGFSFPQLCRYKQCYVLPGRYAYVSNPCLVIAVAACCRTCGPSPDRWCKRVCVRALPSIYYVQRNICKKVDRVRWNQLTCGELTCGDVRVRTKPQFVVVARSSVFCRRFQGLELNVMMVLSCCYCTVNWLEAPPDELQSFPPVLKRRGFSWLLSSWRRVRCGGVRRVMITGERLRRERCLERVYACPLSVVESQEVIFSDQQVGSTSLYYDLSLGVRSASAVVVIRTPPELYEYFTLHWTFYGKISNIF